MNCCGRWFVTLVSLHSILAAHSQSSEIVERRAKSTLTALELNRGDTLRFTLANGQTRTMLLEETWAEIVLSNLKVKKAGLHGGATLYRFGCRVIVDGQPMEMLRFVPVQESFYEPYVVDGMRIWFDAVKVIGGHFNENHGECLPRKDARFAVQDATLPICSEEALRSWYPNQANYIDVHDSYNGDDVWLGPYQGADLHGGLDINMPIGTPLWAPIGFDDQFYFNSLGRGDNNNRWRGIRRWKNGDRWVLQAHHVTQLLVPEHRPIPQSQHYAVAAGVLTGSHAHSHFAFKVGEDGEEILLDPWIVFWQIFENNKRRSGAIHASMASLVPAATGTPVEFHSTGSRPGIEGNGLSYCWTFGDGGCSHGDNPSHIYAKPGMYPVTVVIDDGASRASMTQHIAVCGDSIDSPVLALAVPDEIEFMKRPLSATDVYATAIRAVPYTLRFRAHPSHNPKPTPKFVALTNAGGGSLGLAQFKVEYKEGEDWLQIEQAGDGNAQTLRVGIDTKKLAPKHGVYRAAVQVFCAGAVNSAQDFSVELTTREATKPGDVVVDNLDAACSLSPWCWVAPRFHSPWPSGFRDTFVVAARSTPDAFARYQPYLAKGSYEVSLGDQTPYEFIAKLGEEPRFSVRVRHATGVATTSVRPLTSRQIGVFEFAEGNDGFVTIEAIGSNGVVIADSVDFRRLDQTQSKSPAPAD